MEKLFKDLGYQLLALPNSDTKPKDLLCKSGTDKANRMNASIDTLFVEGDNCKLPIVNPDIMLPEFRGRQVLDVKTSFGAKLLNGLLQSLGVKEAGASAEWANTDKVVFSFKSMLENNIPLSGLDTYIHDAEVNPYAVNYKERLEQDDIYVITSILKCSDFSIENVDFSELGINASAAIPEILEAHANFKRTHTHKNGLFYTGDKPLTIAVKAVRIFYEKPWWADRSKAKYRLQETEDLIVRGSIFYLEEENGLDL